MSENMTPEEAATLERIVSMIAVTKLTQGTADALQGDPTKVALANFVNGVHAALYDPTLGRRLSDAAEYMVTGEEPRDDTAYGDPYAAAQQLFVAVGL